MVERLAGAHPTRGTRKLIENKTSLQALPYSDRSEGDREVTEWSQIDFQLILEGGSKQVLVFSH